MLGDKGCDAKTQQQWPQRFIDIVGQPAISIDESRYHRNVTEVDHDSAGPVLAVFHRRDVAALDNNIGAAPIRAIDTIIQTLRTNNGNAGRLLDRRQIARHGRRFSIGCGFADGRPKWDVVRCPRVKMSCSNLTIGGVQHLLPIEPHDWRNKKVFTINQRPIKYRV